MGKHQGKPADEKEEVLGPIGKGPHPTPEQSAKLADSFERQWSNNEARGKRK